MYNVKCPCIYQNLHRNFVLLHSQKSKICVHKSIFTVLQYNHYNPKYIYNTFLNFHVSIKTYTEILYFCIHRNPKFVCINPYLLYYKIQSYQNTLQHLSQFSCIYQNLHRNFVLLHSQKSKICVHKSIFTVLQNTSTTLFSIFMYLSKLTQKFCTSAFTEIQNLCA